MEELKMSPAELTRAARVGSTMVHDILKRGQEPSAANLQKIATALGMSLAELLEGREPVAEEFPIVATVSNDGPGKPTETASDSVRMKLESGEAVAIRVQGDVFAPIHRDGDTILGVKRSGAAADNLIGLECIACTADDKIYVRFLARGSAYGRFTLRGHMAHQPDIEDVKLKWVAPVAWIARSLK